MELRRASRARGRPLLGRSPRPPGSRLVRWVFLRGLGLVYLVAFTSLRRQVVGLYGKRGLAPARDFLQSLSDLPPGDRLALVPSLLWFDSSDRALLRRCRQGQIAALALTLDASPRLAALELWALYLSFVSIGQEFLSFQWDALLLEAGLAGVLVAGEGGRGLGRREPPSSLAWLLRGLAFRLHFGAGLCKLQSRDPSWRGCTACAHHYQTQPLPTRAAWWAHQLPPWAHRLSTATALAIEIAAPWLVFAPRRLRRAGFAVLSSLQALIAVTGNYGFFNLLTEVVTLWMLDDEALAGPARRRARRLPRYRPATWPRRLALLAATLPLGLAGAEELLVRFRPFRRLLRRRPWIVLPLEAAGRLQAVHSYGLFAVMTTRRLEIVIEGSDDGVAWKEYGFRWKPGDPRRAPRLVAPLHPRLDWQMWFAAMGPRPPWFDVLVLRLLQGEPSVLALLGHNPFPDRPPRRIRALLYDYRMTDRATRRRTGAWWRRELLGTYLPPARLPEDARVDSPPGPA